MLNRTAWKRISPLELAHGYVKPIEVDNGRAAGGRRRGHARHARTGGPHLHRDLTESINIIAIAQGSSELTIAVVVRRDGLEAAVRAVHHECGLGATAASTRA